MKAARAFLAASAMCGALAHAEPAVVEAVQYPAWLERGGNAVPLTPGTQLQAQDRLRTGTDARVQLRLGEGSTVKLGENARFTIEKVDDRGLFRAALAVLAARYDALVAVVAGTTIGMLLADVPVVFAGKLAAKRIPFGALRKVAAGLFVVMGIWVLWNGM